MDINYEIHFHSYWHCSSGLSAGADIDTLVLKNADNLPYVPGRTMKGLVRDAINDICAFKADEAMSEAVSNAFGTENSTEKAGIRSQMYFSDAVLNEKESKVIVSRKLSRHLYQTVASTAIGQDGVALEHSLRKIQVTVPCVLEGKIMNVPEDICQEIQDALKYIKRLGHHRNRGLGRCTINII